MLTPLLAQSANEQPAATFIQYEGRSFTRTEILDAARRVGAGLSRLGVSAGDRVAIICPSRPEMVEMLFGCWAVGAIAVPLNVFLKGTFLRDQLEDADPSTVVVDGPGYRTLADAAVDAATVETVVTLDPVEAVASGRNIVGYDELRATAPLGTLFDNAGSLASIMFTSGTTGRPKGCMLEHGYYRRVAIHAGRVMGLSDADSVSSPLPLYHFGGQGLLLAALECGSRFVVEPEFRVTGHLERLAESKATVFAGVGAMGEALLRSPPSVHDRAHSLRLAYLVPFSPEQHERFAARFGVEVTAALYGQTECVPISCTALDGDRRPGTAGTVPDDLDVVLVDGDGAAVAPGEVGEILIRPRERFATFAGYWRADPSTFPTPDRWHATGDLARFDDGYLTFVDRKKDAIRRRGENVSSIEVEVALTTDSNIAEAAVFGVPSDLTEEDIMAACVLVPGAQMEPAEFFALCVERLPYFAIPRYFEAVEALPRNAVNRVMKHMLRSQGVTKKTADLQELGLTVDRASRRASSAQQRPGGSR